MATPLLEIQYLPPIPYIATWLQAPAICLEQHEHYTKGSFRNRCHIATASGILRLSVPLRKGKHQQMPITEVMIDNATNWQSQHWKSIQTAYGKAPYWLDYADAFLPLYEKNYERLWNFCLDGLKIIRQALQLRTEFLLTESYQTEVPEGILDLRNTFTPDRQATSPLPYPQIFEERTGFTPYLSILDLIFCLGTEASAYLKKI